MSTHRRNKAIYAAASLAAVAWLPTGVYAAQPAGQSVAGAVEEVLVTARRREESLQDVPIAISAFGGDDLQQRGVESVANMNAVAPNLSVMGGGATGESQGSFRVRGIPGVSVYIDGVWQSSTDGLLTMSVVEVERMEVLRGPQGTLFGNASVGGAVQYVTKAPADTFGARAQASIGSFNRRDLQVAVDLPLTDTLKSKFTVASQSRDGFMNSTVIDRAYGDINDELYRADFSWKPVESFSARYNVERTDTNRFGPARAIKSIGAATTFGTGANAFSTNPQLQAYIQAFGVNYNNTNNASDYPGGTLGKYDTKVAWENPGLVIDVMRHTLDLNYEVNDWLRTRAISGYRETTRAVQTDFDGAAEVILLERDFRAKTLQFTQELQFLGSHERFDWVVGGYYSKENNRGRTVTWGMPEFTCDMWSANANNNAARVNASQAANCRTNRAAALGLSSTATNAQMNAANLNGVTMASVFNNASNSNNDSLSYTNVVGKAYFGDITWRATDKLSISAGLRYSSEESTPYRLGASGTGIAGNSLQVRAPLFPDTSPAGDFFGWAGGDLIARPSTTFSAITKRLTVQYQWNPDLMTYIGFADGYGPGGTSTVDPNQYGAYADIPIGTLVFDKQTLDNYEIGMRADWFDGRLRTNVSAFYTTWHNIQSSTYIATNYAGPAVNPALPLSAANPATQIDRNGDGVFDTYVFPALRTTNIDAAKASGIEFEGTWRATDNLRFNLNLGYLKTEYTKLGAAAQGVIPAVTLGSTFAQAPEITGNLSASYAAPLAGGATITPRLDYTYTDDYVLTTDYARQSMQKGFGLLNARITYDAGTNWSVALAGTNLTGEYYLNSGFYTVAEQIDFVTLGRPREFGLTFNFKFD